MTCVSEHPTFMDLGDQVLLGDGDVAAMAVEKSFSIEHGQDTATSLEESSSTTESSSSTADDKPALEAIKAVPKPSMMARRQVSFTSLEIREYPVVPGVNPQCSSGCPIELGWEYHISSELSLDQYETDRSPRRHRDQLRLSVEERESLLSANDCTAGEVRRAARRHHRTKSCEGRFCQRSMQTFFQK